MMMNEAGTGHSVVGELYELDEEQLTRLGEMESIGKPGNFRVPVRVVPIGRGTPCTAFAYMKSRALADPTHTDYLESYQDRRFIPPERRPSP